MTSLSGSSGRRLRPRIEAFRELLLDGLCEVFGRSAARVAARPARRPRAVPA